MSKLCFKNQIQSELMLSSVRSLIIIAVFQLLLIDVAQALPERFRCMWRDDPSTSMVIGWDQVTGSNPMFYFSEEDHDRMINFYSRSKRPDMIINAKGMFNHFVRLNGLKPNTVYYFVVKDSEGTSNRYSFKTAPASPDTRLSIIAGGDSRNHRDARRRANKLVAKLRPHCVIFAGDMTEGDSAAEWKRWFDDWQLTIGTDGRLHPIIVARGNHEKSNKVMMALFDLPSSEIYYSLTLGGTLLKVFTLNSLDPVNGEQATWLERELKSSQFATWRFAQYHQSMRPHTADKAERNDMFMNWAPLFSKYKVQLVMESDAHVVKWTYPIRPGKGGELGFVRDDENGTVYIGEGCWGAPLRNNNDDKSWTRNSGSFNQFKWIFVDQSNVEVRTVMTDCADRVPNLGNEHVFQVPRSLQLWQPSNGGVLYLKNKKYVAKRSNAAEQSMKNKQSWDAFPQLFPNAKGKVRIEYKLGVAGDISLLLIDRNFKPVLKANLTNQVPGDYSKNMDVNNVEKGRYLLVIKSGKEILKRYQILKP